MLSSNRPRICSTASSPHARRRELERQRDPVQAAAHVSDGRAFSGTRRKAGAPACARATKSCTAGHRVSSSTAAGSLASGTARGGTRCCTSPARSAAARGWWPGCAAPGRRRAGAGPGWRRRRAGARSCPAPAAAPAAAGRPPGRPAGARPGLAHAQRRGDRVGQPRRVGQGRQLDQPDPAGEGPRRPRRASATWRATRVLPTPPTPVSVTRRASPWPTRSLRAATSCSRPIRAPAGAGRFEGGSGLAPAPPGPLRVAGWGGVQGRRRRVREGLGRTPPRRRGPRRGAAPAPRPRRPPRRGRARGGPPRASVRAAPGTGAAAVARPSARRRPPRRPGAPRAPAPRPQRPDRRRGPGRG